MLQEEQDMLVQQIDVKALKFNPISVNQSQHEFFANASCAVCFKFHEIKNERKTPYEEKNVKMLTCYGCGINVHNYCYGVKTPYNEERYEEEIFKMFVCDKCKEIGPDTTIECAICLQKSGCFKKTSSNSYAHILCALTSDLYEIDNFENMSIHACPRSEKRIPKQNKHCELCAKTTHLFKCSIPECDSHVHIQCAFVNRINNLLEDEESTLGWAIRCTKDGSQPRVSFDVTDPVIPEKIRALYVKGIELSSQKGNSDSQNGDGKKKKVEKKKSKQLEEDSKEETQILSEDDEKSIEEMVKNVKDNVGKILGLVPPSSYTRGGKMVFECQTHRTQELYCYCGLPYDGLRFMIGCDCCDNWFHANCLSMSEEVAKELETFFCKKCKEWTGYKHNFFEKYNNSDEFSKIDIPCKLIDKSGVVPKDTSRFTILDFLVLSTILQIRLNQRLTKETDFNNIMTAFIDSSKYIPFNLNGVISTLIKQYYFSQIMDKIIEKFGLLEGRGSLHSIFNLKSKTFDKAKVRELHEVLDFYKDLQSFYESNNFARTETYIRIENLTEATRWLFTFYTIFSKEASLSFSDIQDLLKKGEHIEVIQNFPEMEHVKSILSKSESWHISVKNLFKEKVTGLKQKLEEIDSLQNQSLPLGKALESLDNVLKITTQAFQQKPTLLELKEIIAKGEEAGLNFGEDMRKLREEAEKGEKMRKKLKNKIKTFEEFQTKIHELQEVIVSFPELFEFLELYHKGQILKLKITFFTKHVYNNKKKDEDMKDEDEENKEKENKEKETLYQLSEIKETVEEVKRLDIDFGPDLNSISDHLDNISKIIDKIHKSSNEVLEVSELRALGREISHYNINYPEREEFKKKQDLYSEIKASISKSATPAHLAEMMEKLKANFKDSKTQNNLSAKLAKARELEEQANEIIAQQIFSRIDISGPIKNLIAEIKNQKIDFPQRNDLQNISKSVGWLEKLHSFYQKYFGAFIPDISNGHNNGSLMEIETSKESKEPDSIESMIEVCRYDFENKIQEIHKHFNTFKNLIKEAQAISHCDRRIKEIYLIHGNIYWTIEASILLDKGSLKPDDIKSFSEMAVHFEIDPSINNTYQNFLKISEEYDNWINQYQSLQGSVRFQNIFEDDKEEDLKDQISELINIANSLPIILDEELKVLKSSSAWLEWSKKARQTLKLTRDGGRIAFEGLQELYSYANLIKIPQDSELYMDFKTLYESTKQLKEKYIQFLDAKNSIKDKLRKILKDPDPKNKKKELAELVKSKPTLQTAKELANLIHNSSYYVAGEDMDDIEIDIQKCEAVDLQTEEFFLKYKSNQDESIPQSEVPLMTKDLNLIRTEMSNLVLQNEETEQKLTNFEWLFHADLIVNKKGHKSSGIEVWKKLSKMAQKSKIGDLTETKLYKQINSQIEIYNKLAERVSHIKGQEELLLNASKNTKIDIKAVRKELKSEDDIKELTKDIEACRIDMPDEKKYFEDLLSKAKKACENYKVITSGTEKPSVENTKSNLDTFLKLPIKYSDQEKILEGYLEKAKKLQLSINDWKTNHKGSKIEMKLAEIIHNQYKECPVFLPEANKLSREFVSANQIIEKIEKISNQSIQPSFDDISTLGKQLEDSKINLGSKFDEARRKIYLSKIRCLRSYRERVSTPSIPISFNILKMILIEGYSLLSNKDAIRELKSEIVYFEGLVRDVEKHLSDLYNIRDAKLIDDISHTFFDFIDLREEIIDYKAQLSISHDYRVTVESIVKNIGNREDGELIAMFKSKDSLQSHISSQQNPERKLVKNSNAKKDKPSEAAKRKINPKIKNDDFIYDAEIPEDEGGNDVDYVVVKKVKEESNEGAAKKIVPKIPSGPKKDKVDEDSRNDGRKRIMSALKANSHFSKAAEEFKNYYKQIEMHIFSDYHEEKPRYIKKISQVSDVLTKLKDYKYTSKKLVEKKFDFQMIQKLVTSDLEDIEEFNADQVKKSKIAELEKAKSKLNPIESTLAMLIGGEPENDKKHKPLIQSSPNKQKESKLLKKPSYLEDLSDDERQKKNYKRNSHQEETYGVFSDGEDQIMQPQMNNPQFQQPIIPEKKEEPYQPKIVPQPIMDYNIGGPVIGEIPKKKEAILYDPEMKEEEEGAYDPLKEYNPIMSPVANSAQKFEKGSVLRIFKGKIRHNLLSKDYSSVRSCNFYTTEYCDHLREFPKLPEEIKIAGKISVTEAMDYIERLSLKQQKDPSKKQLIVGWITTKREYNNNLDEFGRELQDKEKVAVSKYSEFAGMYFLHPSTIRKEFFRRLDWRVNKIPNQPDPQIFLLYVIYLRGTLVPSSAVIEPEFIALPDPKEDHHFSPEKKHDEQKGAMSPLTPENEEVNNMVDENFIDLVNLIETDPDLQKGSGGHPVPMPIEEYRPVQVNPTQANPASLLDLDDQLIVEKLQKMSNEELMDYIARSSETDKEKIISILSSVVNEEKVEEKQEEPIAPQTNQIYPGMGMGMGYQQYPSGGYMNKNMMGGYQGMGMQQGSYQPVYMPQQQQINQQQQQSNPQGYRNNNYNQQMNKPYNKGGPHQNKNYQGGNYGMNQYNNRYDGGMGYDSYGKKDGQK